MAQIIFLAGVIPPLKSNKNIILALSGLD